MKIECSTGVLNEATGSSRFSHNGTTVFCAIHGPVDSQCQLKNTAAIEIKWYESTILNNRMLEKYFSSVMSSVIPHVIIGELDPFKTIHIDLYVSDACRNTLFCAFNAVFLALSDAGIPLRGLFYATSSFLAEEEVFVYFQNRLCYRHAFGEISLKAEENARKNLEEVQEYVDFALKDKLVSSII
eukprot:jgi/Antlo1/1744/1538